MIGRIHLYFGILVVIIFVLTGQYMHHNYNHLQDMELLQRALFRTGHLYILLFGLINAALGINLSLSTNKVIKVFQLLSSAIVLFATILVIYSFFTEQPAMQIERPLSRLSLYMILGGISVHGIGHIVDGIMQN